MPLRFLFLAFLVVFANIAAAVPHGGMAVRIELRADAVVDTRSVLLADIAIVSAVDAGAKRSLETLRICNAPMVGRVERVSRDELDRLVRKWLSGLGVTVEWSGARAVNVRSAARLIEAKTVVEVADNYLRMELGAGFDKIEIDLAAPVADVELPLGNATFKPRASDAGRLRSRMPVWVDVYVDDAFYRSVVVPFAVAASRMVYAAGRDMEEGSVVFADDFVLKTEEVTSDAGERITAGELQSGIRLKKALATGQVLTRRDLSPRDTVFRGEQVTLVVAEGAVMVEVPALVQHDARIGQQVKVRMEQGMDTVAGRLVSPGVVRAIGR